MVFLDTCIWIELCCASTPSGPAQQKQAQTASQLLADIHSRGEKIITCREQLLEIVSAILKIKMKEYNKNCKANSKSGVGQLKDYRGTSDFSTAQALCKQAVIDVCTMAAETQLTYCDMNTILNNIHLVDINDFLYYQHCVSGNIEFYTFDNDFSNLNSAAVIHVI